MKTPCKDSYDRGAKFRPKETPQNEALEALGKIEMLALAPNPINGEVPSNCLDAHFIYPLTRAIRAALEQAQKDRLALECISPFVECDFYENCSTPEFKQAVYQMREALTIRAEAIKRAEVSDE